MSSTLANSPHGAAAKESTKYEVDKELPVIDRQTNQVKPEEFSTAQEPETLEHAEEIKTPSKEDEVLQQMQNGQGRVVKAELLEEPEPLNGRIPVDISAWRQRDDEVENVLSTEKEKKAYRNRSLGKDPGFELASSVASFHINTTEDIMQHSAEVLCETGQVSSIETQETVQRMAFMKTE